MKSFAPSASVPVNSVTADMLGQLAIALEKLVDSGAWSSEDQLQVQIAGTLKNDKFIVIKPAREKVDSIPDPNLKQKHPYNA